MRSNRSRDTIVELSFRSALHRAGLRFRKHRRPLSDVRCEADVLFPIERLAIFIDGCFWHGCPIHATRPAINRDWWAAKLDGNLERDRVNTARLQEAGWTVHRIWEHENVEVAVRHVVELVRHLNPGRQSRRVEDRE
jgi:DNA mismatch endonuclease, patch repair protein